MNNVEMFTIEEHSIVFLYMLKLVLTRRCYHKKKLYFLMGVKAKVQYLKALNLEVAF